MCGVRPNGDASPHCVIPDLEVKEYQYTEEIVDNHVMEMHPEPENQPAPRLTLRRVVGDFFQRFLNLEHGWLRTARELTTAPGEMICRYVEGHRKDYANPFAYLAATVALSYTVQSLAGYQELMMSELQTTATRIPAQAALMNQITEMLFANMLVLSLVMFIPFAVLLRLLNYRSGRNLAEVLVFTLYCGGHLSLLMIPLMVAACVAGPSWFAAQTIAGLALTVVYTAWAGRPFFAGGWFLRTLKIAVAYLISYLLLMVTSMVIALVWAISFGAGHYSSEDWNLMNATEQNSVQMVADLLEKGADPNMVLRRTPLHLAVEKGHIEIVDLLLANNADINARDYSGRTPLFLAIATRWPEIARTLREAGADASVCTERGTSLLFVALQRDDHEAVHWALDNGVDVNAKRTDAEHATALILAASEGNLEMVELLLERGAEPNIANKDGMTALDLARGAEVKTRLSSAMPDAS